MKRYGLVSLLAVAFLLIGMKAPVSRVDASQIMAKALSPEALPEELEGVTIRDRHVPLDSEAVGVVKKVIGHVVVLHGSTGQAYIAAEGDEVYRQDKIFALKDSRCRAQFSGGDVITLGENSHVVVDEYFDNREIKEKKSVFNMLRGKVMFYVARLFSHKTVNFTVRTPTAVAGVRGTKFGVEVTRTGQNTASARPVLLADASDSGFLYLAAAPGGWQTNVHVFQGQVTVNGQPVGQGQTWSDGVVGPTDPGTGNQFINDTTGGTDGSDGGGGSDGGAGGTGDGGSTGTGGDSSDVSQSVTTVATEGQTTTSGQLGYFSSLLTYDPDGIYLKDVYVSTTRQDFGSGSVRANSIMSGGGYLQGDGRYETTPYVTRMVTDGGSTDSGELGTSRPISHGEFGTTSYMEWGYWSAPDAITIGGYMNYYLDNKAYYLFGQAAPDSITGITGSYSGEAWGTHYEHTYGAREMTGNFGCSVDLGGSPQISNFYLDVVSSDEGAAASINGGSGSFSGSAFEITGGTWTLTSYGTPFTATGKCSGSLYGPNGEQMGGAWGMSNSSNAGAAGIFKGEQTPSDVIR